MKTFLIRRFPGNAVVSVLALLALRMALHQSLHFGFLAWNIFLAVLPLHFAKHAAESTDARKGAAFALLWLLLFPNAAYLVTDIVHLRIIAGQKFWLDLVLLFSAGILGIALSIASMREAERFFARFISPGWVTILSVTLLIASGYGIYLGRVARWNSWDPLLQPFALLRDILNDFRHPFRNRDAWQLTALFAAMQVGSYFFLRRGLPAGDDTAPDKMKTAA